MKGFQEGALKAVKVAAWIAASAIVAGVISKGVDSFSPGFSANFPIVAALVNVLAAGAKDWLDAHREG